VTHSATVVVEPWGVTIDVGPSETMFDAALRQGWQWPTNCFGQCRCTVCHVCVLEGADMMDEPSEDELAVLASLRRTLYARQPHTVLRLACQIRLHGDARVAQRRRPQPLGAAPNDESSEPDTDTLTTPEVTDGQH
jgi:ferredoxin, 2Fe-2S